MDTLTYEQTKKLLREGNEPAITIYMPHVAAGSEVDQNVIRLKNALKEAETRLVERGYTEKEAASFLEKTRGLLDEERRTGNSGRGMVVYTDPGGFVSYLLPMAFETIVADGSRFYVTPLLRYLFPNGAYYLLAVTREWVDLFSGDRFCLKPVRTPDMPKGIRDTLKYDQTEKQLQSHPSGTEALHGQDVAHEDERSRVHRYCTDIDQAVRSVVNGSNRPLVVMGDPVLQSAFSSCTEYGGPVMAGPSKSPASCTRRELLDAAWERVLPGFNRPLDDALARCEEAYAKSGDSRSVEEILRRAASGQVETLLIDPSAELWGTFDSERDLIEPHARRKPGDDNLLDLAAGEALLHGATVLPAETDDLPGTASIAALYRF